MGEFHPNKIREMTREELGQQIADLREELFNLRFRNATRQLDNPLKIRSVKRDLARLLTIQQEHDKGIRKLGVADSAE
jgi:large subunit ribosomal protein L29